MTLWKMSFSGAFLIIVIMVIRLMFRNKLPKRTFMILWSVVLLRLLIPFSIPSVFNVYTLAERNIPAADVIKDTTFTDILPDNNQRQATQEMTAERAVSVNHNVSVWVLLYGAGAFGCAAYFLITYIRCYREFQTSLPVKETYIEEWLASHPLRRKISVRQSELIAAPLTYGIFRPVILLPKAAAWESEEQLCFVLTHEYVHIRRLDAVKKMLFILAICVHWLNPLVWVMYVLANRDMELSCDEAVVSGFKQDVRSAYAFTLISMEENRNGLLSIGNGFSKNAIEERITAIMKMKKASVTVKVFAAVLVMGITILFATSAASSEEQVSDEIYTWDNTSASVTEAVDSSVIYDYKNMNYNVSCSEEFPDYEKYGLSYDKTSGNLMYDNEIVGYFKDELSPGKYRRFSNDVGTVGIVVVRNSSGKIEKFKTGPVDEMLPKEAVVYEASGNLVIDDTEGSGESASVVDSEMDNISLNGDTSAEAGTNTAVNESSWEVGDGISSIPADYLKCGITLDSTDHGWKYKERGIAALYDRQNYIYSDDSIPENKAIYLEVVRNAKNEISSLKEVTKEEMQKLFESTQF